MDPIADGLQTGSDQVLNLLYGPYKLIASSKLIGLVPSLSVLVPIGISPPRVLVPIDISPPRVLVPIDIPPPRSFIYTSQVGVQCQGQGTRIRTGSGAKSVIIFGARSMITDLFLLV